MINGFVLKAITKELKNDGLVNIYLEKDSDDNMLRSIITYECMGEVFALKFIYKYKSYLPGVYGDKSNYELSERENIIRYIKSELIAAIEDSKGILDDSREIIASPEDFQCRNLWQHFRIQLRLFLKIQGRSSFTEKNVMDEAYEVFILMISNGERRIDVFNVLMRSTFPDNEFQVKNFNSNT